MNKMIHYYELKLKDCKKYMNNWSRNLREQDIVKIESHKYMSYLD